MKRKGFTLVEIILSISLIGILFAASAIILDRGVDSFANISVRGENRQGAAFSMERMISELLLLEAGPSGDLTNVQESRIDFTDNQGSNTDFHLTGQTLYRGNDILLENVTALAFTGYNKNNQVTNSTPQTRRIRIEMTTLPPGQTASLTLRTDVFLRTDLYDNFQ